MLFCKYKTERTVRAIIIFDNRKKIVLCTKPLTKLYATIQSF